MVKTTAALPLPKNEYGGTSLDAEGDIRLEDYFGEDESSLDSGSSPNGEGTSNDSDNITDTATADPVLPN